VARGGFLQRGQEIKEIINVVAPGLVLRGSGLVGNGLPGRRRLVIIVK
jgi:hypothetical protein